MQDRIERVGIKEIGLKWGLISGVMGAAFNLIMILKDLTESSLVHFGLVLFAIVIWLAHKELKEKNMFMSFGEGLKIGLLISLIGGLVLAAFMLLYDYIYPEYMESIKIQMLTELDNQDIPDDQLEMLESIIPMLFNSTVFFILTILSNLLAGLLLSLIVSAFTKKENPEFEIS